MATKAPELEAHSGSWVVSADNGRKVFETFNRSTAERAVAAGWKVETIAQYLARINAAITSRPSNQERRMGLELTPVVECDSCHCVVRVDEAHIDEVVECHVCGDKRAAYELRHAHPAPPSTVGEYLAAKGYRS